jgi:hypothetical protein
MQTLTARRQTVTVMTVNTLRAHLERISSPACKFSLDKVRGDRVSVRSDYILDGKKKHSYVLLPCYPTGHPADATCNNVNVVLEPLDFIDIDSCSERIMFAPLLGIEMLGYFEKMHPHAGLPVSRCC